MRHFVISFIFFSYLVQTFFVMLALFLCYPKEGRYLSSYILSPYYDKPETKPFALVLGCLFESWFMSTQWAGLTLQIYVNMLYLQTMSSLMSGLRSELRSSLSHRKDKLILRSLRGYSKLQLLSSMYNETMGRLFLSRFKSTTAVACVSSAFVLVKLFGMKDPFIICFGFGAVLVFVGTFTLMTRLILFQGPRGQCGAEESS